MTDLLNEFCENVGECPAGLQGLDQHMAGPSVGGTKKVCGDVDRIWMRGTRLKLNTRFNDDTQ